LASIGVAADHVHIVDGFVVGDFSEYELKIAGEAGLDVHIVVENAEVDYSLDHPVDHRRSGGKCLDNLRDFGHQKPVNFEIGSYKGHFTYDQMNAQLEQMEAKYPDLISKRKPIGDFLTEEGRPIEWIRISDNPEVDEENEPEMLYTALHHAREPVSMTQLIYYMWYLLENYAVDAEIKYLLDNTELYFVPCVNPDGYIYNETNFPNGGGLWRKNRRRNSDGSFGVDLNRNYGDKWGHDDIGSSSVPVSETYRGTEPFSEVETQAIREFVMGHDFKIALNYHSYGDFLIYPYGYTDKPAEDADVFRELANLLTSENKFVYGTSIETVSYPTNGDSDDWMYGGQDTDPIIAMTPEVGNEVDGFWPNSENVEFLCRASLKQNLDAALFLLNSGLLQDQSEQYFTTKEGRLPYKVTKLGFQDVALNVSFEPITDNITLASPSKLYFLDVFDSQDDYVGFTVSPDIQDGERIKIKVEIDNGTYLEEDTIIKYYREPRFALNNDGDESDWKVGGLLSSWSETGHNYVSEPTSLTDSPNGNTVPYTVNHMELKSSASLLDGDSAVFTFKGYWDIQNQFDYLTVEISTDGRNYDPLCGRYSVPGRLSINKDLPIYTGRQLSWVNERIDLSSYLGEEVTIRFTMTSTNGDTRDGAYIDDIRILQYNQGDITSVNSLDEASYSSIAFPNPASEKLVVEANYLRDYRSEMRILFYNQLGQKILDERIVRRGTFDTSDWPTGLYFYSLIDDSGNSTKAKKVLISQQ